MANKNKSVSSKDKPQKGKDGKPKKDKKPTTEKKEVDVMINEENATKIIQNSKVITVHDLCLLYTSPSPRDATLSRMPSSA